ncbi:alkaline phytoceramidase, partial [Rhizophagus irregularis]|uniref:Ceramidase n=3 Tax=Rhizophagus irregularis TaxID=588596 RepID=U9TWY7_RHIID|eukprot:XP_025181889.1 ceramidase [Rhizophagus irregularis DAOM 181602=DAOM 197198]
MSSQGIWPLTSSVDWCEDNYAHSYYIAEFWNTISSIAMIIFGEVGARINSCNSFRFRLAFRLISVVGLGSLLFHGTLTSQMQALDEVPMVWSALTLLYSLIESIFGKKGKWLPILLALHAVLCTASITITTGALQFAFFHISFGSLEIISLILMFQIYSKKKNSHPPIKYLFEKGLLIFLGAVTAWLIDLHLCDYVNGGEKSILPYNPQLHAMWHILASVGLYLLVVLILYNWHYENGRKCKIEWRYGGLVPVCRTLDVENTNKTMTKAAK